MAATQEQVLEQWFRDKGGYLHPSISICHNTTAGTHWRATQKIEPGTLVSNVPHTFAFSYLNALVDERFPVFQKYRASFKVEAIGFFYLVAQYNAQSSFWKPYLDTLPKPTDEWTTPFWFDDPEDIAWLEGTDVWHTCLARKAVHETYHQSCIETLARAGVPTELYTWDLFRWAISVFSSRAFSSRALYPQDSKYWTTYKSREDGRRQTVLLDLSKSPSEDLDFPVLFPVQDAVNHDPTARVDWTFDPGRFGLTVNDPIEPGEFFNNYGPKSNNELLLGYGFCIPDNPYDTVLLTLKQPPEKLQTELRQVHPGYFNRDGLWNTDKATFRIRQPSQSEPSSLGQVFNEIPESLLELLTYMLRHQRGLPFHFIEQPLKYVTDHSSTGRRYLPHVAHILVSSLAPKLSQLQTAKLPQHPINAKQCQASIYRDRQAKILTSLIAALRDFTQSMLSAKSSSRLVNVQGLMQLWSDVSPNQAVNFSAGIEAVAGTSDIPTLLAAGWEDDLIALLLGYIFIDAASNEMCAAWVQQWRPEYIDSITGTSGASPAVEEDPSMDLSDQRNSDSLMPLVKSAAEAVGGSLWASPVWKEAYIAHVSQILEHDHLFVGVADPETGRERDTFVVYLHA